MAARKAVEEEWRNRKAAQLSGLSFKSDETAELSADGVSRRVWKGERKREREENRRMTRREGEAECRSRSRKQKEGRRIRGGAWGSSSRWSTIQYST